MEGKSRAQRAPNGENMESPNHGLMSPPSIPRDPFLTQYIRNRNLSSCLNNHQLYFNSIDKQRKLRLYEVYQKYLIQTPNTKVRDITTDTSFYLPKVQFKNLAPEKEVKHTYVPKSPPVHHTTHTGKLPKHTPEKSRPKASVIVLPREFMDCPMDGLITLISRMLHLLITLNDKSVHPSISTPKSSKSDNSWLTRYHSRTPPSISTFTYLTRLCKFNNFNAATLLTTIYYIDLLSHQYQPYFTLNSWTVHRFLLVATMLAQKSMEDFFYTNDHYAKVGGVATLELNCLELDFLERVDWRCIPTKVQPNGVTSIQFAKDVLDMYYSQLIELMGKNTSLGNVHYILKSSLKNMDSDDDDDDDEDDDYYSDEDMEDENEKRNALLKKYDAQGRSVDGSSSPHLKRKRTPTLCD